nr:short chain dehydrogenase asqe [Quercus suber]
MSTIPAPLAGKVAIVTGGSRGIGAVIAKTFARHGCSHIAITYGSQAGKAQGVLDEIKMISPGVTTAAFAADLRDEAFGQKIVAQALEQLHVDHIDIVVSNAALVDPEEFPPTASVTRAVWDSFQHGLCWAPLDLARSSVKVMPQGGRIIFMSSGASRLSMGDPFSGYCAGKAAMEAVARNLAVNYGKTHGVTVNSISVGPTGTEALNMSMDMLGEEFSNQMKGFSILKRIGTTQEVADIVAFIASPQAAWITGNLIPANGGGMGMLQG